MFSSQLCHKEDGSHEKCPVKTCGVSDDLSGDVGAELPQTSSTKFHLSNSILYLHIDFNMISLGGSNLNDL